MIQVRLNVMYYVVCTDIDPFRRYAAFKSTEFRPSNKPETALRWENKFCPVAKHRKRFWKKLVRF